MNRLKAATLSVLLASGCGGNGTAGDKGSAPVESTFISGATIIPGNGSPAIDSAAMIIENDVIKEVGKAGELHAPKGSLQPEYEGKTLIPLFINLSAYPGLTNADTFGVKNYKRESLAADLNRYGYYGVVAVVAGTDSEGLAFQHRDEQHAGKVSGARLLTSGRGISAKGSAGALGPVTTAVGTVAEARTAVADLVGRKADVVVLWASGMKADVAAAAIDEAHKGKLKVLADAPTLSDAKDVVKAGVNGLIASVRDREVDDELISLMKEKKVSLAPGLSSLEARFVYADKPGWLSDQALREVYPPGLSAYLSNELIVNRLKRNPALGSYRQEFATASKNLKKLADAGVAISFGSGSGMADTFPGYFEHRELELMVAAGLSPMDAIKASSFGAAQTLGIGNLGVLTPGMKASFMVLADNPLDRVQSTRSIDAVFVDGKKLDRLGMIQAIEVVIPKITQQDRAQEAEIQRKEAEAAAEAKEKHYGKFVLARTNVSIKGDAIVLPAPRRSQTTVTEGPPHRVVVSLAGASGADLREFYLAALPKSWVPMGSCWERPHPLQTGKTLRMCGEPGGNQITLTIAVQ